MYSRLTRTWMVLFLAAIISSIFNFSGYQGSGVSRISERGSREIMRKINQQKANMKENSKKKKQEKQVSQAVKDEEPATDVENTLKNPILTTDEKVHILTKKLRNEKDLKFTLLNRYMTQKKVLSSVERTREQRVMYLQNGLEFVETSRINILRQLRERMLMCAIDYHKSKRAIEYLSIKLQSLGVEVEISHIEPVDEPPEREQGEELSSDVPEDGQGVLEPPIKI
ncbi:hypothetical protein AAMO2058_000840400 [Amorphochlora amoebiformis]